LSLISTAVYDRSVAPELRMSFVDTAGLERELAQNLKYGRAFVAGAGGIAVLSDCALVLVRADGGELRLTAQAVMVMDAGVGLELRPFGPDVLAKIEAFASGAPGEAPAAEPATATDAPPTETAHVAEAVHVAEDAHAAENDEASESPDAGAEDREAKADEASDAALDDDSDEALEDGSGGPRDVQREMMHERLRKLSQVEQQKVARHGDLSDRVMLERLYGKAVWEGLLHNPKLTVPEVARMARKGTMPRPMVELIVDNQSWVQQGAVRRALLGNPRVSGEGLLKILRATPKHELKVITKSTAYTAQVREAARKLLKT
jgi:hypothetical protein